MSEASGSSRSFIVSVAALVVALVAGGLAVWALMKEPEQPPQSTSLFAGTPTDDPKASICRTFAVVRNGVQVNTNLEPPGGPEDVTGSLAVAANARLALYDGGQYLLARLQPDTPQELADAVRTFANHLMDIGSRSTAGIPNTDPEQTARLREADAASNKLIELCQ